MGTLDVLQSGIHLLHEVADIGPDLMGIVDLDVVLDGSRIGHATGAAVVDGDGLVQRLNIAGAGADQIDLERNRHGLAIRAGAVGERHVLRPSVRPGDLIELDVSVHPEMAVGVVDHLNDVVAAAGGRKPRELTAVRRRSSRHRRGRRGRGTAGKGAGLSRNGNATQTQQQDGASGEVRGAGALEQRRQHGAAGAEQCPDLFHLWLSHRECGPGD